MNRTKPGKRSRPQATPSRTFTLEHANRTLPLVRRIVSDAMALQSHIGQLERAAQEAAEQEAQDKLTAMRGEYTAAVDRLRELAEELAGIGCELKDAQRGLVDFPAQHDGRLVYLCWMNGEPQVTHWHELDSGFAGRCEIEADFKAE